MGKWTWWRGRWTERDACGCFATMDEVESGEAEHICRNGGSPWGPFSRFMKQQDPQVRADYVTAMEAAAHDAEMATNGYLTRKGAPRKYGARDWYPVHGRPPSPRWASDELLEHWDSGGQPWMSFGEFRRGYQEQFAHPAEGL